MQLFISHLASWLHTRRFSEPIFDPPEPQIIGKTQRFATLLPFPAPASSVFWLFFFPDLLSSSLLFSSLTLPTSAFHLSILSEVWLLNFLRILTIPIDYFDSTYDTMIILIILINIMLLSTDFRDICFRYWSINTLCIFISIITSPWFWQ